MLSESSAYHKFASGQARIIFGRPHIISLQWPEGTCFLTNRISQAAYNKNMQKACQGTVGGGPEESHIFPENMVAEVKLLDKCVAS